ncbi:EFR1 family ferrodoxin [Oscillibacter ruminantium]|nr:EFR1 family ferrodoxin [Oscillibacter valericigenes]
MEIEKVRVVYYSATGTTEKVVTAVAEGLARELGKPLETVNISSPAEREKDISFTDTDLVVVGTPTYAGRIPNKMLPYFQTKLTGNGALGVPVVLFGNRNFDNSLAELCAELEAHGFHTVAAAAFVGQHAFATKLAAGRPDEEDLAQAERFGKDIAVKIKGLTQIPAPVQVSGDPAAPYYTPLGTDGQPAKFLKAKPQTDPDKCTDCGLCAAVCPMGSIDPADVSSVPGVCIKCQACVVKCPTGAKYFDDPAFLSHKDMLETNYTRRAESQLFF